MINNLTWPRVGLFLLIWPEKDRKQKKDRGNRENSKQEDTYKHLNLDTKEDEREQRRGKKDKKHSRTKTNISSERNTKRRTERMI